mgnify:FL=1
MKHAIGTLAAIALTFSLAQAQQAKIQINVDKPGAPVAPTMWGIFFEEINHAADGGLYAELIENRSFDEAEPPEGMTLNNGTATAVARPHYQTNKEKTWKLGWKPASPHPGWTLEGPADAGSIRLGTDKPLNDNNPRYLRLEVKQTAARLVNGGYWGINVVEGQTYKLSFFGRCPVEPYSASLRAGLISPEGEVLAEQKIGTFPGKQLEVALWHKQECELKATKSHPRARFFLALDSPGTIDLDVVSLFPAKTFKDRPNGCREDVATLLAEMKPSFIRFPGGCYVEGATFANRYIWKRTVGPIEQRPGHWCLWGYRSTDGMGYHEFLQFCQDIGADALYVANCGLGCEFRTGDFLPEDQIDELIQDTLDAIEYAIGPADSKWGKLRAAAGHPEPFPLRYIQIGNENHGPRYKRNYQRFYKALKAKYPQLQYVYCCGCGWATPDMIDGAGKIEIADEHFYRNPDWFFNEYRRYDNVPRDRGFDLYVGEYACNQQVGRGNMLAALSEAAFMIGMERNGDLIKMTSYAPLLFNVNRLNWPVNLIGYDSAVAFGRSSYYVQKLFATNRPDVNVATSLDFAPPAKADKPKAAFAGRVGLGAWDTEAEYKDFVVEPAGQPAETANFDDGAKAWQTHCGTWKAEGGAYRVSGSEQRRVAMLTAPRLETGTIRVKARKIAGHEGFLVLFGGKTGKDFFEFNLGGWGNKRHAFEIVNDNRGHAVGRQQDPGVIETGKWYDIRIEIKADEVIGYLDGKEVARYRTGDAPNRDSRVYAQAGLDKSKGEVILKAVNATPNAVKAQVNLAGAVPTGTGRKITLAAASEKDENDINAPKKIAPKDEPLAVPGARFETELAP